MWEPSVLFWKERCSLFRRRPPGIRMKKGFTLFEVMVVLAVMAISMALFYSTLMINWTGFEKTLSHMELQLDADTVSEMMSFDSRYAKSFAVGTTQKAITLVFPDNSTVIYRLLSSGVIERQRDYSVTSVSTYLKYADSFIRAEGNTINYSFVFHDFIFGQEVQLLSETKVNPRNRV